eukprot:GFYU01000917.1.p1 GENE.GFYU01000917.1~~GFYU01000917.1.p1  ORF type:complete len:385 (+),score=82.75 GFYU01000917.1:41-1156(+)
MTRRSWTSTQALVLVCLVSAVAVQLSAAQQLRYTRLDVLRGEEGNSLLGMDVSDVESDSSTPLCPNPSTVPADDDVHIKCKMESASFIDQPAPAKGELLVMAYNIDRNGRGGDGHREGGMQPFLDLFTNGHVPMPDVLLLSEVSRGCGSGSDNINGARFLAENLKMSFAYAVEYVEVGRTTETKECSIGNAVLSRYPLDDPLQIRFEKQCCRYGGRIGGRVATGATVQVGDKRVPIFAAHMESGKSDVKSIIGGLVVRQEQGAEMAKFASQVSPSAGAIVGGDFNAPLQDLDPTVRAFLSAGYVDAHSSLWPWQRVTVPDGDPRTKKLHLNNLDYILATSSSFTTADPHIGDDSTAGWSDHVPIWATVKFK